MSERLLHNLVMLTRRQENRRIAVAEVMNSHHWQLRGFEHVDELSALIALIQRCADR